MTELAPLKAHASILDMGAGGGGTVRLLRELGYAAQGIDIEPRGENVEQGDMLHTAFPDGSFDGVISQCAFYVSGDADAALQEAYRILKPGGVLMLSDVCFTDMGKAMEAAGFEILHREDMTARWREYYIEAIWRGDTDCIPVKGKCTYEMLIGRKEKKMDLYERIIELSQQGYYCSQILMKLMLETVGEDNPELVKAMMGLCGGVGFSGGCCGCMTAGTCMISYLTGKGSDDEPESADHKPMMKEFTEWFKERMVPEFGSINCCDVIHFDPAKRIEMCPPIIADTYEKCIELLQEKDLL